MNDLISLEEVVTVISKSTDNFIIDEMGKAIHKIGVYIDESKLKEWIQMCMEIEKMSPQARNEISKELEYKRLKRRIEYLNRKIDELREE